MSSGQSVTLPAPTIDPAMTALSKWEREFRAFRRLLPQLLQTHRGQYVAVHDGQVVGSGSDKLALALRVFAQVGNVPIHVGLVTEEAEPVVRSGLRRVLSPSEGAR
jgi:hypothetical protein